MDYPWYEEIKYSDVVTQGDVLLNCCIPLPDEDLYQSIINNLDQPESNIDLNIIDAIILSQACDIEHGKIDSIVLCPIWSLGTLMDKNEYYQSSQAKENLRQGKEPAYHLLNNYSSGSIKFDLSVVDFHRIYSLPKEYIKQVAKNMHTRLRLLPPYREHLSQAFARYFMRVGLPVDIEKSLVKNYTSLI